MDSSDDDNQLEDEDVLCKYGTALTPYEAGNCENKRRKKVFSKKLTKFR